MCVAGEGDGFAHAIGAVVFYHRGHNAAVGFTVASVFLESNVSTAAAIVGDKKDVVLSHLSVHDVGIFVVSCVKAAVVKVSRGIEIGL